MHGSLLAAFAIYLCFSKREPGSVGATFAEVRYLFLLMGLFSTYCGAIYNDYTSLATQMFGESCYTSDPSKTDKTIQRLETADATYWAETVNDDCVYPFGIDHIWFRSA